MITTDRLLWHLRRAQYAFDAEKERRLYEAGISGPHWAVLAGVGPHPGITSAGLARRMLVSPQNVAGLVAKVESQGWLERRAHPGDSHARELYLTEAGREVLARADAIVDVIDAELAALVGHDGPGFTSALDRISERYAPRPVD